MASWKYVYIEISGIATSGIITSGNYINANLDITYCGGNVNI